VIIKNETRVLFIYSVKTGKIDLRLYAVIRGDKGLEHLGVISGGIDEVIENARKRGILDEVRFIVDLDGATLAGTHTSSIRQKWVSDILKILSTLEREIVRLIGT